MIELLIAYGYELEFSDETQRKSRYSNDVTFIDIWTGKKGITVGIYQPDTKTMQYYRHISIIDLEKKLINL